MTLPTVILAVFALNAFGAEPASEPPYPSPPAVLPSRGLAQHDFLYSGEWDTRKDRCTMFLVRGGKFAGTYQIPRKDETNGQESDYSDMHRLANGNTIICNWTAHVKMTDWLKIVQMIEVTPPKRVVWAFNEWTNPDPGPASCIQLLDETGIPENRELMR